MSPEVGDARPAMVCSRVDLPQPEGPTIETKLPFSMSRSTPLSATVVPPAAGKLLCRPRTRSTGLIGSPLGSPWARSGREHPLGQVDRRLQQPVFLHHPHCVVHF